MLRPLLSLCLQGDSCFHCQSCSCDLFLQRTVSESRVPHSSRSFYSFLNVLAMCSAVYNTPISENGCSFPVPLQPGLREAASSAEPAGPAGPWGTHSSHATWIRKNCFWRRHRDLLIREHLLQQNQYICNLAKKGKKKAMWHLHKFSSWN